MFRMWNVGCGIFAWMCDVDLEYAKINILLYQILAFTTHGKNIKTSYKNNKFKILAPTWNEELELPDGS